MDQINISDFVIINFQNTLFSDNDFICPIGNVDKILNDATHDTAYLVNGYWWHIDNLEKI